ncbi:MAG: NAD(P)-dependent oxidoreductase [Candidatus Woykebacteria bacterium]
MIKQKFLITGSRGLIGSILSKALSEKFEVFGTDVKEKSEEKYYGIDLSDLEAVKKVFNGLPELDCIIHLGADANPNASWESVLKNNIIATRNIYECAREFEVPKVIFASTNRVTEGYEGNTTSKLVSNEDAIRPKSYYGVSKAFGEAVARQFFEVDKIKSICLRIGSVLKDDDPRGDNLKMKKWLSHRDLVQLIERCLESDVKFGIYYGISNNKTRFYDISDALKDLGYTPQDDSSLLT